MLALISSIARAKCRAKRVRLGGYSYFELPCLFVLDDVGFFGVDAWVVVLVGAVAAVAAVACSNSSRTQERAAATARFLRSEPE